MEEDVVEAEVFVEVVVAVFAEVVVFVEEVAQGVVEVVLLGVGVSGEGEDRRVGVLCNVFHVAAVLFWR